MTDYIDPRSLKVRAELTKKHPVPQQNLLNLLNFLCHIDKNLVYLCSTK